MSIDELIENFEAQQIKTKMEIEQLKEKLADREEYLTKLKTCLNAKKIVTHFENSDQVNVSVIIPNKPTAQVLQMAAEYEIPTIVLNKQEFYSTEDILKKFTELN